MKKEAPLRQSNPSLLCHHTVNGGLVPLFPPVCAVKGVCSVQLQAWTVSRHATCRQPQS